MTCSLWLCQKFAIENDPVEIVDVFPLKTVDLSTSLCKRLPGRVAVNIHDEFPTKNGPLDPLDQRLAPVR